MYRHYVEPRVQLHVLKEETFPAPLKHIDVTRTTHTKLDVLQEGRIDDCWNIDVDRTLSDSWTGFTKFTRFNEKHPSTISVVQGAAYKKFKQLPDLIIWSLKCGPTCQMQLNERKSSIEPSINRSLTMRESWEASIYLSIQMMESSKKPWKNARKSLRCRWKLHCFASYGRRSVPASCWKQTAKPWDPTKSWKQSMHASWKLVNLWESLWNLLHRKVALRRNGSIHQVTFIRCTKFSHPRSDENSCSSGQGVWEARKMPTWQLTKVKSKKEFILEAQKEERTVHFATLMDICHLKKCGVGTEVQKYKDRIVLRGDSVKDDSGSHAVFTEQGSSTSQMTAAKVMDIIARLLDHSGQAADAVSVYTEVKMKDTPKLLTIPKSECPDMWIRLPRHKWQKIMVKLLQTQWCFSNEIYTDIHLQASCGKDSSKKFYLDLAGKKCRIENASVLIGLRGWKAEFEVHV